MVRPLQNEGVTAEYLVLWRVFAQAIMRCWRWQACAIHDSECARVVVTDPFDLKNSVFPLC